MDFRAASSLLESVHLSLAQNLELEEIREISNLVLQLAEGDEDEPKHLTFTSLKNKPASGKRWLKVRPGKLDKPGVKHTEPASATPSHISFKSVLQQAMEAIDDSPEGLGAFLHRHFGARKWTHDKVMRVAQKAHKKPKEFARAAADHYVRLNKGHVESRSQKHPKLDREGKLNRGIPTGSELTKAAMLRSGGGRFGKEPRRSKDARKKRQDFDYGED